MNRSIQPPAQIVPDVIQHCLGLLDQSRGLCGAGIMCLPTEDWRKLRAALVYLASLESVDGEEQEEVT